jgi:Protein of unknown function (DUF4231)
MAVALHATPGWRRFGRTLEGAQGTAMTAATTAPETREPANGSPEATAAQLTRVIDRLRMPAEKKEWMRDRWLDQVLWFDRRARQANRRHMALRITAIAGGVLVPGLVSLNYGGNASWSKPLAFAVSLLVAVSVGLDGFFHFGDRWRHFRRTAELLKIEGWLFIEGGGRYKAHRPHSDFHDRFFSLFATKVEELVRRDVEVYLTQIVQEKPEDHEQEDREVRAYLDARDGPLVNVDEPTPPIAGPRVTPGPP